ncbi:hypothetical protein [Clostridium sp. C8-1-8]|nr:hypothetical protein [Clostridium sp. C8-1-8]
MTKQVLYFKKSDVKGVIIFDCRIEINKARTMAVAISSMTEGV